MAHLSLCSGFLLCFTINILFILICQTQVIAVNGFSTLDNQKDDTTTNHETPNLRLKANSRSGFGFGSRFLQMPSRSKIPLELDLLFDGDNEIMEKAVKRYDDYGHLRFGKRGGNGDQFDDYGHMRFGRSTSR